MKLVRKLMGSVGVDSGQLLIVDPCYIKHHPMLHKDENWDQFCKERDFDNQVYGQSMCSGVVSCTRNGDGEFPVYGIFNKGGELLRIEISFTR